MKKIFTLIAISAICCSLTATIASAQDSKDSTFAKSFNQLILNGENNRLNLHDPLDILKAQAPGVTFNKKGSNPNEFNSVNIRGKEAGFTPDVLYIIDGIVDADPSMLLPDDIESIEIIKDGAQLTAYGTQGNAGVIVITTKHYNGEKKIAVNFSSFITLNTASKKLDLLSADQVRSAVEKYDFNFTDGGSNTDWQNEIMRKPVSQIYNLGISGKLSKTTYDFSAFYDKNPGIVKGSSHKNNGVNLRINQSALADKLNIYTKVSYNIVDAEVLPFMTDGINELFFQTLRRNPTDPVFESDGVTYHQVERDFRYYNPLQIIDATSSDATSNNLRINAGGTYNIINGLVAGINFGISDLDYVYDYKQNVEAFNNHTDENSSGSKHYTNRLNAEAKIDYSKVIADNHNLLVGAIIKYRTLKDDNETFRVSGDFRDSTKYIEERSYTNYILHAGYNFNQRYFINAIANIEASELTVSGFQTSLDQLNRKKFYPSVMVGWEISNEKFLEKNTLINHLLLKASYGIRGNGNADKNVFYKYFQGIDSINTEKITELGVSLDFGLFNNRVNGTFGWYNRNIDNAVGIYYLPVPPSTYYYSYKNANVFHSSGFEAMISVKAIDFESLKWSSQLNFFLNREELKEGMLINNLGTEAGYFSYIDRYPTQLLKTGYPSRVFFLPANAGYSEDGVPLYYTETGTKTREFSRAKLEMMSQRDPKYYIGWVNSFNVFSNFDLSFSLSYTGGYSIYNATRMYLSNPYYLPALNITEEGLDNLEAGYRSSAPLSELYLENASYLRVEDLTLSYTLTCDKMKNSGKVNFYVSAGNLFTITDFTGYDPAGSSDGVDYFDVYPLAKTYTFGIRFKL